MDWCYQNQVSVVKFFETKEDATNEEKELVKERNKLYCKQLYKMRCSIMHEFDLQKFRTDKNSEPITCKLYIQKNGVGLCNDTEGNVKSYNLGIETLCEYLFDVGEKYYAENKDKFKPAANIYTVKKHEN